MRARGATNASVLPRDTERRKAPVIMRGGKIQLEGPLALLLWKLSSRA